MSSTDPLNERLRTGPQHHLHGDTEPLPGSRGGATTIDYTPETIGQTRLPPSEEGNTQDLTSHLGAHHRRHHDTQPSSNTADNLLQHDEGARCETMKPSMGDKIVGKAEEIAGKVSHNPQMQAKGTQRAHGETTTVTQC